MTVLSRKLSYALIMIIGALFIQTPTTVAQDVDAANVTPERLAKVCIAKVKTLAARCNEANKKDCARCIEAIIDLLDAGRLEAAVRLARHCVHRIARRSNACVDEIHEHCRRCVKVLLRLQEPELARRVAHACDEARDSVRRVQRACITRIRSLFGNNAPDLGDDG